MLILTDNAATAVRGLTHQPDAPDGSGLRIATDPAREALTLTVTPQPWSGDQVVDTAGARLFLDSEAATMLEDKALDATTDGAGWVKFTVAEHPG
jgi:iron-sulfur cluster assembly protein